LRLGGFLLLACACAPAAPAKPAAAPHIEAKNLKAPPGTTLVEACTPTGHELCFNAIDDNCNGVIDEGCGSRTGLLQFEIAWDAADAEVDLSVTTPEGETVPDPQTHPAPTGFHMDKDCPGKEGCGGQNVDNIYYDTSEGPPPRGHYVVTITLKELHGASPPVRVRFGARLGSRTVGFDVNLAPGEDEKKKFEYDLP
jgi:tRNA (guanosine-2'-O-)-methyltransferase